MGRAVKVNEKEYVLPEIGFNLVCDLEDRGISLESLAAKPVNLLRVLLALAMKVDEPTAGLAIEQHLMAGGDFGELIEAVSGAIEDSGFFRSLREKEVKAPRKAKAKSS